MADDSNESLDYSRTELKKINKATESEARNIVTLILDENELQKLDCVDSYLRLENLSVCKNSLLRMYGVGRLTSLRHLNLSNNSILTIEGLKELVYLKKLQLACNNIKSIEHLNNNVNLEYLDLSDNQISHITDISYLKNLKHLYLDKNRIGNLKQCERYLPGSLVTLGLSNNFLTDLNTLCHLAHLSHLECISVEGNPCVMPPPGHDKIDYDYRPFVINWVMNVKTVDGYEVSAIESLKAEWLYSQGRGRQFREGEQEQLTQYLCSTCPRGDLAPETEDQRKLRLILSKAQHHQQQLREQGPSPPRAKHSPRMHARIAGRVVNKSPDRSMSSSFHSALTNKHHSLLSQQSSQMMSASFSGEIPSNGGTPIKSVHNRSVADHANHGAMSQSFDASSAGMVFNNEDRMESKMNGVICERTPENVKDPGKVEKELELVTKEDTKSKDVKLDVMDSNKALNQPLEAASKMVPVPDSLMSPDYQGPLFAGQPGLPQGLSMNRRISGSGQPYPNNCHNTSVQSFSPGNPTNAANNVINASPLSNSHSELPVMNCRGAKAVHKNTAAVKALGPNARNNNKGSPQLSRSAMSSPKLRNCADQRKGSFSSRVSQQNTDEMNIQSAKNLYNQTLQSGIGGSPNNFGGRKVNGANKTVNALSNQMEIQVTPPDTQGANSSDDDSEMCMEKLQSIRDAAKQRRQKQSLSDSGSSEGVIPSTNKSGNCNKTKTAYCAAVTIQKLWRGYRTRNLNQKTGSIMHSIQTMRARQYIEKLSNDMEATKAALDSERKIQQLQMQAINALWKKISAMEVSCGKGDDKNDGCPKDILSYDNTEKNETKLNKDDAVRELTQTCTMLQAQVQQLQGSMRDILRYVSGKHSDIPDPSHCDGIATQTEISAVHTPQGESSANWPYHRAASRPCSLSLSTVQSHSFKKSQSHDTDKSDSVQNDVRSKESSIDATEKDTFLPGQTDKHYLQTKDTASMDCDKAAAILISHQKSVECGSGDTFSEDLKKECLGVASSERDSAVPTAANS